MNSQHNTFKHSKLLKCLRCENKDCTESISKTRKTITLTKKNALCAYIIPIQLKYKNETVLDI